MKKRELRLVAAPFALGLAFSGCAKDDPAIGTRDAGATVFTGSICDLPAPCKTISRACMPKDDGTDGPVHSCHSTGMERGIESECQNDVDRCVTLCNAAPGFSDGPAPDPFALCTDAGRATDASGPVSFPTTPLLTFMNTAGDLKFELRTAPDQPIHIGPDGKGELKVFDATSGAPVDGLTITVTTWMPVMGHTCGPIVPKVTAEGQGTYLVSPLLASMKGACELKLTLSGTRTDHIVSPTFDIPP